MRHGVALKPGNQRDPLVNHLLCPMVDVVCMGENPQELLRVFAMDDMPMATTPKNQRERALI
jgi:hypothetical protein